MVYWAKSSVKISPSITVTTPILGQIWQPGEEHSISWITHSVPASNKISVTIRRIPPPPLREEGQEFDPIIFTDLPNTGSTTWKISPMYPDGTYVLSVHIYESLPITNDISGESAQFTITHPKINTALYPLYNGADWNASEVENFIIGTTTYSGASIFSYPISAGMNPGSIFTPFEKYYDQKLKALGWKVANDLAAGGMWVAKLDIVKMGIFYSYASKSIIKTNLKMHRRNVRAMLHFQHSPQNDK